MTAHTSTIKNKPLKWTTQRVKTTTFKPTTNHRVRERTPSNTRTTTRVAAAMMTAEIKTNPKIEIERLQSELEFAYDTVATITVHFESLHHAYTSSKPELEKSKSVTRLGEMEKELLTAYDDLGLQVIHLERKINKLEKRLSQLRQLESIYVAPTPVSAIAPTPKNIQQQPEESPLIYDLISSPCSSTDSSIADGQLEPMGFYCDDWTLSQTMANGDQPILYDNSFPFLQAEMNNCNSNMMNYTTVTNNNNTMNQYYQDVYYDLTSTMNMYSSNDLYLSYPSYTSL